MRIREGLALLGLGLASLAAGAQTTLPGVTVTAPGYTRRHGGYLISGDFRVDPRMPYVVFPAQALVRGDILDIHPVHLNDDEYLVLQECVAADCSLAKVLRVWSACRASIGVRNSDYRVWITHENKYFAWLKRLPTLFSGGCAGHFDAFEALSPPLVLLAQGPLAARYGMRLAASQAEPPVPVKTQAHEGATFVVTYLGGSTVRIQRMHASR